MHWSRAPSSPKTPLSVVCEAIGGLLAFRGSPPPRGCPGCRWGGRHQSGVCSDGWQRVSMANTSPKRFLSETVHTLLPRLSWPLTGGASLVAQLEPWVRSLGWGDPLEK